jgi:hypothetical protein
MLDFQFGMPRHAYRALLRRGQVVGTRRIAACAMALLWCIVPQAARAGLGEYAKVPGYSLVPSATEPYAACPPAESGRVNCLAIVLPVSKAHSAALASPPTESEVEPATVCDFLGELKCGDGPGGGYSPSDLRAAYRLPSTSAGSGEKVAIVDAYDDPNAEADMNTYRGYYGIPACTKKAGCFSKVNQTGGSAYPVAKKEWAIEISLDLDMVSATCPSCRITLVEATNNFPENVALAESEAATLGANEISNSYGSEESAQGFSGEKMLNKYYEYKGIPVTVSAGDLGYDNEEHCIGKVCGHSPDWPAVNPAVISVGMTVLTPAEGSRGWSEEVGSNSGGGCSLYEPKPKWQVDVKCPASRTDNDVAAVGDSSISPVSIYDSFESESSSWWLAGGTSVGAPLIAGTMALEPSSLRELAARGVYANPANWFDITEGRNWSKVNCESYLCKAGAGYDGPTGVGTPNGGAPPVVPPGRLALTAESNGNQDVYFRAANAVLQDDHWNAGTKVWTLHELNGVTPGSSGDPTAVVESSGNQDVYYRSTTGAVLQDHWIASEEKWTLSELGGAAAGNPAAVVEPDGSSRDVYFRGTTGAIWQDRWSASESKWTLTELGGSAVGDPAAVVESGGNRDVYFRGTTGAVWQDHWSGGESKWTLTELGGSATANPTALVMPNGDREVFFRGSGRGYAEELLWSASTSKWKLTSLGGSPTGSISAILDASGKPRLFYRSWANPSGEIKEQVEDETGWMSTYIAGDADGEPAAMWQNGSPEVFTPDIGAGISQMTYIENWGWSLAEACNGPCQTPGWASTPTPNPIETLNSYLWGVSCATATFCTAVGEYEKTKAPNIEQPLVETWNGTEWTDQTPSAPGGSKNTTWYGVSCPTSTGCSAIGYYQNGAGTYLSLAEGWTGGEWQFQSVPEPGGTLNSLLSGVSCGAATDCHAVGWYENSSGAEVALGEHWNGVKWAVESTPDPSGAKATYPYGVTCVSSALCTMVGYYQNSSGADLPFAEKWTGGVWSVQSMPAASEAKGTKVRGVSCFSATACAAVGVYENNAGVVVPLAEIWNGSEWTIQTVPGLSGAKNNVLDGVSCTSSTNCTSAGVALNASGKYVTLAERWNGAQWSIQPTPNQSGAESSYLAGGVSCASAAMCAAAGNYHLSLAEVYG